MIRIFAVVCLDSNNKGDTERNICAVMTNASSDVDAYVIDARYIRWLKFI